MNVEVSASVCCSCDAVRMSVENDVLAGFMVDLRGRRGRESTRSSMVRLT